MPEPLLYLQAMGAAAIVSALCVLVLAGVRLPLSLPRLNAACVFAMGLGLATGCRVLSLSLAWPPVHGLDRFLTIVVPMLLGIELIAGFPRVPRWLAWLLRMSLASAIPGILLHGSVYLAGSDSGSPVGHAVQGLAVCAALLAGVWGLLAWLMQRSPGASMPLALSLAMQGAGLAVMMAGYIKGGAAAFLLTASLATTTIGARLFAKHSGVPGLVGIGVAGLFSLLFIGRFFGRLSTASALAMLLAPLLCWATELPLLRHRKPWIVGSLRLVLVAIPLLLVLFISKRTFDRDVAPLLGKKQPAGRSFPGSAWERTAYEAPPRGTGMRIERPHAFPRLFTKARK
jgi:hypothetical protein